MAELEFFIDPELPPSTDLGKWQWEVCMIPDPEGDQAGEKILKIKEAFETGIVKHPTVAWFLGMTVEVLEKVGVDLRKIRFRSIPLDYSLALA